MSPFVIILASACVLAGILTVLLGSFRKQASKWETVEAYIESAEIVPVTGPMAKTEVSGQPHAGSFKLDIVYRYSFRGNEYSSSRIFFNLPNIFERRHEAEEVLERFPPGEVRMAYVNPSIPSKSSLVSLQTGRSGFLIFIFFFLVLLFTVVGCIIAVRLGAISPQEFIDQLRKGST